MLYKTFKNQAEEVKLPRLKSLASSPFCKTAEAYLSPD